VDDSEPCQLLQGEVIGFSGLAGESSSTYYEGILVVSSSTPKGKLWKLLISS